MKRKILLFLTFLNLSSFELVRADDVSLNGFCSQANEANAVEGIQTLYKAAEGQITTEEIRKTLRSNPNDAYKWRIYPREVVQWNLLVHPSTKVRLAGWGPVEVSPVHLRKILDGDERYSETLERAEAFDEPTKQLLTFAEEICIEYGANLWDVYSCGKALRKAIHQNDTLQTQSGLILSNIEAWKRVMNDPFQILAANHLATKIHKKVESASLGKAVTGTFYQDILESYHHFVKDPIKAENKAWDMIMLYATRGPVYNLDQLLNHGAGYGLASNFGVIFVGLHVLDSFSANQGFLYSLPASVNKTTCLIGKPYHFWYAAALTRDLLAQGYSQDISRLVTYILGNLYNFGTTIGTDNKAYYRREVFHPQNNNTRISMASRRLGIEYVTRPETLKKSNFQLDQILRRMIVVADPNFKDISGLASKLPETMSDYLKFRKLFSVKELNPYRDEFQFAKQ